MANDPKSSRPSKPKPKPKAPSPRMLGSGMANRAGEALSGRRAQIERQLRRATGLRRRNNTNRSGANR